jgi:hypothetical protein
MPKLSRLMVSVLRISKENHMFKQIARITGLLALVILMGALNLSMAQSSQGGISGTVTDSTGAVVGGATIDVTNAATGEKRSVTASENGEYAIPNLTVGLYTITANATGFAPSTIKDVKVSVAFTTDQDITLNPAGASETVVVSTGDAATQLNSTDQQISTIIENKKILDLPLLSRDPSALILLSPGVNQSTSALGGFTVNGQRPRNNNFLVDGIDDNDAEVPGIPGGLATPNIDAIQEFRVITSNFNAEYGRNTGAIIINTSKGGTNEFHGGAYIYYRSDAFSARNFFDLTGNADPLDRKQFGGTIGGPIIKDKAFFFFNYEGDRFKRASQEQRFVPSALARTGVLVGTGFGTLDLRPGGANNEYSFPLDPAIQQILRLYPTGNDPAGDLIPGVLQSFRFVQNIFDKADQYNTRVDYRFNDKYNFSARYTITKGDFNFGSETFPGAGDELRTPQKSQGLTLTLYSTFTPNLTNELRFGGNRTASIFNGPGDGGIDASLYNAVLTAFGAQGYATPANVGGANGRLLNLTIGGIQDIAAFDTQYRFAGTTQVSDAVTWVKGSHTFKTGGEFRWVYSNGATNFGRTATLNFNVPSTFGFPVVLDNMGNELPFTDSDARLGGTINNFASFLYGFVATAAQSQYFNKNGQRVDQDLRGFRTREMGVYFQDTWKVRPNFTLNYGLRYEYQSVPYEVNGQLSTLVDQDPSSRPPVGGFRFQLVGRNSGNSVGLWESDRNNWAPRFGFNWSPGFESGFLASVFGGPGKSSIRGGYGVFYDRVFGNLFSNARGNPPFQQDYFTGVGDLLPFVGPIPQQVASPVVPAGAGIFPVLFALPGNNMFQSKFATPYTQAWNFGIQRELGNTFLFEADYIGNKGTNLLRVIDGQLNSIPRVNAITGSNCPISSSGGSNLFSGCSALNDAFFQAALNLAAGFSTYNALQVRVTKRLTNRSFGLGEIQAAYTWSHSIDDASDALVAEAGERTFPRDSTGFAGGWQNERGNSGFDVRHRFVLNYQYEFPLSSENKLVNYIIGDWSMSGIFQVQSGNPYSIFGTRDSGGTGLSQRASYRDTPGAAPTITNPRVQTGPTANLFTNPPLPPVGARFGIAGNVQRNSWVGPGFNRFDLSLMKRIPFGPEDRYKIRLQADFFNLFNRVNFGQPINTFTDPRFGQSTTAGNGRVIQFVGRFEF